MMYPEVHTLAGANIRLIGAKAQDSPNAIMADRIILQPSHQKENLDPLWDP
jgi:hypothetical protein